MGRNNKQVDDKPIDGRPWADGKEQQVYECRSCDYSFVSLPREGKMICPDCGGTSLKNVTKEPIQ